MSKLQTPAIVALALLVVVVMYSLSQDEGGSAVVTIYTTEKFLEGDWNQSSIPPDRWIGIITTAEGWNRFPGVSGYSVASIDGQPDFDTTVALVAYMGMMPSEGYRITIERVEYTAGGPDGLSRLDIGVHVSAPGANEVVAQVLTHPSDTILIPKESWPDSALDALSKGRVMIDVIDQNGRTWGPGHML